MLAAVLVLADVDGAVGIGDLRHGTFTFASGAVYVGEYQDSKQHGQGKYTYGSGSFELSFYVAGKQSGESVWFSQGSLEGLATPSQEGPSVGPYRALEVILLKEKSHESCQVVREVNKKLFWCKKRGYTIYDVM